MICSIPTLFLSVGYRVEDFVYLGQGWLKVKLESLQSWLDHHYAVDRQ